MKPVLVLQHLSSDGPAYLATWMQRRGVPFEVRNTDAGEAFPAHTEAYAALAILGGEMSANDPLPSLRQAEMLILDAMARSRPVIGHCLGGQLIARALGARVGPSLAPEIGWHPIELQDLPLARQWFGGADIGPMFQWHEEAFDLPVGATLLAHSPACAHQAFAIGPHLAMQFHLELDEAKLKRWSSLETEAFCSLQQRHDSVQSGAEMRDAMPQCLPGQQVLADMIYARWLAAATDSGT